MKLDKHYLLICILLLLLVPLHDTTIFPIEATNFHQISGTDSQITVQWLDNNSGAAVPTWYHICVESIICKNITSSALNITSTLLQTQFDNLHINQKYIISIITQNSLGQESSIQHFSCLTGLLAPTIIASSVKADFATLDWSPTIAPLSNVTIEYQIEIINLATNDTKVIIAFMSILKLFDLIPETTYLYSISPITFYDLATITTSDTLNGSITTQKAIAPTAAPNLVDGIYIDSDQIIVLLESISIIDSGNCNTVDYQIEYSTCNFTCTVFFNNASIVYNHYAYIVLKNLQPLTVYFVRARGRNVCGDSPYSKTLILSTTSNTMLWSRDAIITTAVVVFLVVLCLMTTCCALCIGLIACVTLKTIKQRKQNSSSVLQQLISDTELQSTFLIVLSDLSFVNSIVLGGGSQGTVCTALYKGVQVAVKMFSKSVMGVDCDLSTFANELKFLAQHSNHTNIVRLFGVSEDTIRNQLYIVTEYCDGGNLATIVTEKKISFDSKIDLLRGIASGMSYLHSQNIVHRDLKCENILLDMNLQPKIIDFGLSRQLENSNRTLNLTMNIGTPAYLAPEIIKIEQLVASNNFSTPNENTSNYLEEISSDNIQKRLQYDIKADIYSFAIIMYVVYFEVKNPYGNVNELQLIYHISKNQNFRPKLLEDKIQEEHLWYIELMKCCWDSNPNKRPSFEQIIQIIDLNN